MKKRKFKILRIESKIPKSGGILVTFHTKVGPFRYFLSNAKVLRRFLVYNPKLLPKNVDYIDLRNCEGKFLFVPELSEQHAKRS